MSEDVFALPLPHEPQEVLLVEELQVVGLQLRVLIKDGDDAAVHLVEELAEGGLVDCPLLLQLALHEQLAQGTQVAGSFALAKPHHPDVVPRKQLQEERVGCAEDDVSLSLLQLGQVRIVDSDVRMEVAAVLERVEQADGSEHCLADPMRVVAHQQQRTVEHHALPNRPQVLVGWVELLGQLHLLEPAELQQHLLRHPLLQRAQLLPCAQRKIFSPQHAGSVEVVEVIGYLHGKFVLQNR